MITRRGMEAINFLNGSTLAKELTRVFQDVMDYRDGLDFSKLDGKKIREARIKKVYDYVSETMGPEFIKVVAKETNLDITKITYTGTMMLTGFFAVSLEFDNLESSQVILQRQTGNWSILSYPEKQIDQSIQEMTEMTKNFDITTGKLSSSLYGPGGKRRIKCELYMDAMMAFLLHDFMPVHFADPLTAQELAAIYLHEIGHVLTVVERSDHAYYTVLKETEHLKQIMKADNKKELFLQFAKTGVPYITEMVKNKEIDPKVGEVYLKAVKAGTYILEQEEGSVPIAILELLLNFYIHLVVVGINFFTTLTVKIPQMSIIMGLVNEFTYLKSGVKVSDLHQTHHNKYSLEQKADEFVSRHGMGSHIASGLGKIYTIFSAMSISISNSVALRKSTLFSAYLKGVVFMLKLSGAQMQFDHTYEHQIERTMRLVQNAHAVFKNDLPPHMLDAYLADYDMLTYELKKLKSSIPNKIIDGMYKYIIEYVNPATFLSMTLTGRALNDYEKHQNQIEDMINNSLYAVSAKFKQLANRK